MAEADGEERLNRPTGELAAPIQNASSADQSPTCRICFDSGQGLIQPCACRGTMKFVHRRCLNEWRLSSCKTDSYWQCELCLQPYTFVDQSGQRRRLYHICLLVTNVLLIGIILGSGFIMKTIELALSRESPHWQAFTDINGLHVVYGILLPAAVGLGPFCIIVNIGAPHILHLCLHGTLYDGFVTQTALEIVISTIGVACGLIRVRQWIFDGVHDIAKRYVLEPDTVVDLTASCQA